MNTKLLAKSRNHKRRVERRLHQIEREEQESPMLSGKNLHYDIAEKARGTDVGGIGAIHLLARRVGLPKAIDSRLSLLKRHLPYHESDHVLNIAYNAICGARCLEDIELRRSDEAFMDGLGADRIPDPTTAGDFCRRFESADIETLMETINDCRLRVWRQQPKDFFEQAIIDADGTVVPTLGECKEGIDFNYPKKVWGYHPLVVTLANTGEPLFIVNRSGNRPSSEGAAARFDQALGLVQQAGFRRVLFRGDTDFSQTKFLDGWHDQGVQFVFGMDAAANLVKKSEELAESAWSRLVRKPKYDVKTAERARPENIKEQIVRDREYRNLYLVKEDVAEFAYKPVACTKEYRIVVVRKTISVEAGQKMLFGQHDYFFYITNLDNPAADVVETANQRCNQENHLAQLKDLRALHSPVDTLESNWAYMVMASLAWSLKAWFALLLPVSGRWRERHTIEKSRVLKMEFRTFLNAFVRLPAQIVRAGRRITFRLLGWNHWQHVFLRGLQRLRTVGLC